MIPITNKDIARGWLAAFIDGEGCVYFRRVGAKSVRVVTITCTDRALIDFAAHCYDLFGIDYRIRGRPGQTPNRRYRWTIDVRRAAAMQRVLDEIPIQHPEKLRKLRASLEFARGVHCKACGCLHDNATAGCVDCRKRHQMRGYYRQRIAAAAQATA